MCGKIGKDAIESMQNMMSMSVYYVIADCLDVDAMDLEPNEDLDNDLHMTDAMKSLLSESIIDMFNGRQLDYSTIHNIQDVVNQVITTELHESIH